MTVTWQTRSRLIAGVWHIDVKAMQPPEPMVAIMALLAEAEPLGEVIVHHDRDPIYLYPLLNEHGWQAQQIDDPADLVCLRITRLADHP